MKLDLTDDQWYLLLATLAEKHIVLFIKDKDISKIEEIIVIISELLNNNGKIDIFNKVFKELMK